METQIKLYRVKECDRTYEHIMHFKNKQEQLKFFDRSLVKVYNDCYYVPEDRSLDVEWEKHNFYRNKVNYLSFYNPEDDRIMYAFIDNYKYINDNITRIFFTIDYWQTYCFDLDFRECFVERMHQNRWTSDNKIVEYTQDEELNYGELIVDRTDTLYDLKDNYIIVSSDALGIINNTPGGSGGNIPGSGGGMHTSDIRNKILATARTCLGYPYVWGGSGEDLTDANLDALQNTFPDASYSYARQYVGQGMKCFDCSGLTQWSYKQNGIDIGRDTYSQITYGEPVTLSECRTGDLVFTDGLGNNGHVVMFIAKIDNTTYSCIEAMQTGTNIKENRRTWTGKTCARNIIGDTLSADLPNNETVNNMSDEEHKNFILRVANTAKPLENETGLRTSVCIAQAIEESGWGESGLSTVGNALFGIKATESWVDGGHAIYNANTNEYDSSGNIYVINDNFRAYNSWEESIQDRYDLLMTSYYKPVQDANSYQEETQALVSCGYATNPSYATNLNTLIEEYKLYLYDNN